MTSGEAAGTAPSGRAVRARDPRLDFFRGLAMFFIVISHTPTNPWALWIPARFGFSDATEIFVFCSGMASAVAFGATFATHGWLIGTARTLHRVWQVYWAHIGVFVVIASMMVWLHSLELTDYDYVQMLNLRIFYDNALAAIPALLTLRYVPNYFDILPMYLAILAMLPIAVALARVHIGLMVLASVTLWLAANLGQLRLSAAPWNELRWFFNPFGWQLVFFTGFAFMAGWFRPPRVDRRLVMLAAGVLLLCLPFAWFRILDAFPALRQVTIALQPVIDKTPFGLLRYIHFLALAYLAWVAVGPGGVRLTGGRLWPSVVGVISRVGQQSLAVFMTGLVISQLIGVFFDYFGRTPLVVNLGNLAGMGMVIATAYVVSWFKSEPWRRPAAGLAASQPAIVSAARRPESAA